MEQLILTPCPFRLKSPGVTASKVTKRSCRRLDPERPAVNAVISKLSDFNSFSKR